MTHDDYRRTLRDLSTAADINGAVDAWMLLPQFDKMIAMEASDAYGHDDNMSLRDCIIDDVLTERDCAN